MTEALAALYKRLSELPASEHRYTVPSLWVNPIAPGDARVVEVEPVAFYRDRVAGMLLQPDESPGHAGTGGEWSRHAIVYNMFVRHTAAWDHDDDGEIRLDDLAGGFRETGTFLKAIALLPYLRHMGINTIHLLPITKIGSDGNKGTLGSPYAIRNPYELDERLGEPVLGLGAEREFAAFVEAAHIFGMRVVMEFVFRTASKDSDWIEFHPGWFYWIDADVPDRDAAHPDGYGNPRFKPDELEVIAARVRRNDTASLPPPSVAYRALFAEAPDEVTRVDGRYIGLSDGRRVRIPGAFADWPPDDVQPPWNDVTYLKMYDHPAFNYIAYNTIRIYDARLAQIDNENRGLWNTVTNIIPHYQQDFGIDGVMIDMGHALPRKLKQAIVDRARKLDADFAFWEENFAISARSRQEGYNAAVGYLWSDEHLGHKLREFLGMLAATNVPVPFFATPESHNTPRAAAREGGMAFSRMSLVVNGFLPGLLFIHQGYELGETQPVNTGLGFTADEIAANPSHTLPLFSHGMLAWANADEMTALVARVAALRREWTELVAAPERETFHLLPTSHDDVLCYLRVTTDHACALAVCVNINCHEGREAHVQIPVDIDEIVDALTGRTLRRSDERGFLFSLAPGGGCVLPLTDPPAR